jgi:hypothetical protein
MDNSELANKATDAALTVLDEAIPGKNKGGIDDEAAYAIHAEIEKHLDRIRPEGRVEGWATKWERERSVLVSVNPPTRRDSRGVLVVDAIASEMAREQEGE